eukprot:TRINITY_DN10270_c0_g1_i2.p1 TRINITY_DN10270_c0_g1~~TRINITY_DN10270_c0_g1_i2.p1  ORF type:complete len:246 (+),score=66.56 TRINITY_DN10270_c0_g1_i2:232-969(+)
MLNAHVQKYHPLPEGTQLEDDDTESKEVVTEKKEEGKEEVEEKHESKKTEDVTPSTEVKKIEHPKTSPKYPKRFAVVDTGSKGLVFIEIIDPSLQPTPLAEEILRLAEFKPHLMDTCSRLLPINKLCKAELPALTSTMKNLIPQYLSDGTTESFAIEYKGRNNPSMHRTEIIGVIADLVPKSHKVDLKNPDVTIVLEVFKSACGITFEKNYFRLKKFSLAIHNPPKVESTSTPVDPSANETTKVE